MTPTHPYRILDLYCGAGGAAVGYNKAGFEVVGVDISPQPHYPFKFIHWDALTVIEELLLYGENEEGFILSDFDAIHASPPCQRYSVTRNFTGKGETWPDLVGPTRTLLRETGLPYVIENVPGAPLIDPVVLCGSHFGLTTDWDGVKVGLRRHRLFETNFPVRDPGPHDHSLPAITVAGHDVPSHQRKFGKSVPLSVRRELMQMDWCGRDALGQAIPPVYTEYVGNQLRQHLDSTSKREDA